MAVWYNELFLGSRYLKWTEMANGKNEKKNSFFLSNQKRTCWIEKLTHENQYPHQHWTYMCTEWIANMFAFIYKNENDILAVKFVWSSWLATDPCSNHHNSQVEWKMKLHENWFNPPFNLSLPAGPFSFTQIFFLLIQFGSSNIIEMLIVQMVEQIHMQNSHMKCSMLRLQASGHMAVFLLFHVKSVQIDFNNLLSLFLKRWPNICGWLLTFLVLGT